jgi:MoaA/NifB/PqqE/SkfB family radical SAM enzyme
MNKIKLTEMLWELCPQCNKNCSYCGSKEVMNKFKEKDSNFYKKIVEEIIKYPPKEITLTGGEPTICSQFKYVLESLTKNDIVVKIVSNGSFKKLDDSILDKIAQIGYSINTKQDIIDCFKDYLIAIDDNSFTFPDRLEKGKYENKTTMITNFGTHNIWDFDLLYELFRNRRFSCWQIQLTMGDNQLNESGIEYLREKVYKIMGSKATIAQVDNQTIVLSDNLQDKHECSAGLNACSITWDGYVIPCLSERAWLKDLRYQGNLLKKSLKEIWENEFKEQRFSQSKCCRDCIKYKTEYDWSKIYKPTIADSLYPDPFKIYHPITDKVYPEPFKIYPIPQVTMYGVFPAQTPIYNHTTITYSTNDVDKK